MWPRWDSHWGLSFGYRLTCCCKKLPGKKKKRKKRFFLSHPYERKKKNYFSANRVPLRLESRRNSKFAYIITRVIIKQERKIPTQIPTWPKSSENNFCEKNFPPRVAREQPRFLTPGARWIATRSINRRSVFRGRSSTYEIASPSPNWKIPIATDNAMNMVFEL